VCVWGLLELAIVFLFFLSIVKFINLIYWLGFHLSLNCLVVICFFSFGVFPDGVSPVRV